MAPGAVNRRRPRRSGALCGTSSTARRTTWSCVRPSGSLRPDTADGRSRTSIHGEFLITNKKTGEKTQFAVQYPRAGALAGVPIHGVFRPDGGSRWR